MREVWAQRKPRGIFIIKFHFVSFVLFVVIFLSCYNLLSL